MVFTDFFFHIVPNIILLDDGTLLFMMHFYSIHSASTLYTKSLCLTFYFLSLDIYAEISGSWYMCNKPGRWHAGIHARAVCYYVSFVHLTFLFFLNKKMMPVKITGLSIEYMPPLPHQPTTIFYIKIYCHHFFPFFFQFCIFLSLSFTYFPVVLICKVHITLLVFFFCYEVREFQRKFKISHLSKLQVLCSQYCARLFIHMYIKGTATTWRPAGCYDVWSKTGGCTE